MRVNKQILTYPKGGPEKVDLMPSTVWPRCRKVRERAILLAFFSES